MNVCTFCGPTEEPPSDEDLWPHWFSKQFQDLSKLKKITQVWINMVDGTREIKERQRLLLRSNEVCRACNNNWMSGIEKRVIPILKPLIANPTQQTTLTADARQTLATWVCIKALVMEAATSKALNKEPFFTAEQRLAFKNAPHPLPDGTRVYMACFAGGPMKGELIPGYLPSTRQTRNNPLGSPTDYSFTHSFLSIIFEMTAPSPRNKLDPKWKDEMRYLFPPPTGTWSDYAPVIWPDSGDIRWPPALFPSDHRDALLYFARRLSRIRA
jgi:hypothetical protein